MLIFFMVVVPFAGVLGWILWYRAGNRFEVIDPDTGRAHIVHSFEQAMYYYRRYNFPRKIDAGGSREPWPDSVDRVFNYLNQPL